MGIASTAFYILMALHNPMEIRQGSAEWLANYCYAEERIKTARATANYSRIIETDWHDAGFCLGFITGWQQQYAISYPSSTTDASYGQISSIFILYIKNHPEYDRYDAAVVLSESCIEAKVITFAKQ